MSDLDPLTAAVAKQLMVDHGLTEEQALWGAKRAAKTVEESGRRCRIVAHEEWLRSINYGPRTFV